MPWANTGPTHNNNKHLQPIDKGRAIKFFKLLTRFGSSCLVWIRKRLLSAGLEAVLSQTEKSFIASNYLRILNPNHQINKNGLNFLF